MCFLFYIYFLSGEACVGRGRRGDGRRGGGKGNGGVVKLLFHLKKNLGRAG